MQRTMAWRFEGRLAIAVHGFKSPSIAEWKRFLDAGAAHGLGSHLRILIVSHGGGPDAEQRKLLGEAIGSTPAPTIVLTSNALIVAISQAVTLFNPHLKVMRLTDGEAAYRKLGLTDDERTWMQKTRRELAIELGLEWQAGTR
jgi:hypothetical protein